MSRGLPTDHCLWAPRRAYPIAPFVSRHPRTYSWERGAKMPDYSAGGLILRPSCHKLNPAFGDRFFVLKNLSKKSPHPTHSPQATSTHPSREPSGSPVSRFSSPLKEEPLYRKSGRPPLGSGCVAACGECRHYAHCRRWGFAARTGAGLFAINEEDRRREAWW